MLSAVIDKFSSVMECNELRNYVCVTLSFQIPFSRFFFLMPIGVHDRSAHFLHFNFYSQTTSCYG